MIFKKLAKDLFDFMVATHGGPPGPPDPKEYSRGEMGILIYLTFHTDGVTSGQLSESLHVSTGRIASALKSLEKKQLIVRRTGIPDKRIVNVHITDLGKQIILKKHEEAIDEMAKSLQKLGEEDARKYVELSKRLFS